MKLNLPSTYAFLTFIFTVNLQAHATTEIELEIHFPPVVQIDIRKGWGKLYQDHLFNDTHISTIFKTAPNLINYTQQSANPNPKVVLGNPIITQYLVKNHQFKLLSQHVYKAGWVLISQADTKDDNNTDQACLAVPSESDSLMADAQQMLKHQKKKLLDAKTQDNVLMTVLRGECQFGLVSNRIYDRFPISQNKLHAVKRGPLFDKPLIFSASPTVDKSLLKKIKNSLLKIGHQNNSNSQDRKVSAPPALPISELTFDAMSYQDFVKKMHARQKITK